jgi:hypothetical protein
MIGSIFADLSSVGIVIRSNDPHEYGTHSRFAPPPHTEEFVDVEYSTAIILAASPNPLSKLVPTCTAYALLRAGVGP